MSGIMYADINQNCNYRFMTTTSSSAVNSDGTISRRTPPRCFNASSLSLNCRSQGTCSPPSLLLCNVFPQPTTALLDKHHLTCGISSPLHSVNLILFTLLLVHLILRISPHHSRHLCSNHLGLSLPRSFTPDLKLVTFTNPFLHSLPGSFWTALSDLEPVLN